MLGNEEKYEKAIEYYKNKKQSNDNAVEVLYHLSKSSSDIKLIDQFISLSDKLKPVHYGYKRLIDVGKLFRNLEENDKARISGTLGNLYRDLKRFEEAEKAYNEALEIYKKLAAKSPDAYLPYVATTQNNLAILYRNLNRFEEAEKAYNEALEIHKKLAAKSPDAYLPVLLQTQANIGMFYFNINRTEDGISALEKTLKRRDLLPDFGAKCFAGLGNGYERLNNAEYAAMNFMMASASYFLLFRKGIPCLGDVIKYLDKVVKLGEGEMKGDAELIITAITRLAGQETALPEGDFSKRGEALREAFNGNIIEIKPENEIDLMFMFLINEIHQSLVKSTNNP